jgi:hypothetical protein
VSLSDVNIDTPGASIRFADNNVVVCAAEADHSEEHWEEVPSLNTTRLMLERLDGLSLVLHIGDIAYAVRYSVTLIRVYIVRTPVETATHTCHHTDITHICG